MSSALRLRRAALSLFVTLAFAASAYAEKVRFDGHKVVRVELKTNEQLDQVLKLTDDVWSERIGVGPLDVRFSPEQFEAFKKLNIPYSPLVNDVQLLIDAEARALQVRGTSPYDNYMDNATLITYMTSLVNQRPDLASMSAIGQTLQGRNIYCIRITGPGGGTKPGVFYHGCQHAREWITVPVTLYVAEQLITRYDTDAYIRRLVDRAEWFIVPVMNVDGYIYTWTTNRLWRKNRRTNGDGSFGVDLNRNWGYQWGGEGASTSPSSDTYRGPSAFSEPETQVMRDFVTAHANIVTHNDVHSYSQLLLWPWGYQSQTTPDQSTFNTIGQRMVQLIAGVHGMTFTPGPTYTTIYPASGVSTDWAYGARGILSFSFELRDTGGFGFELPADQIIPSAEETFPALLHQADATTAAVKIEYPTGKPTLVAPGVARPVSIRLLPGRETVNPTGATVWYRIGSSGPFSSVPVTLVGGNDYRAIFPGRDCGPQTEWYVTASGTGGGIVWDPPTAPDAVYRFSIGALVQTFYDNFQSDTGWTVSSDPPLTSGAWVRVDPIGTTNGSTQVQPESGSDSGGPFCFVTGQGLPGGASSAADVDGGATRLLSPLWDMSGGGYQVSYVRWIYSTGADPMTVEISNNDGATWTTLESVTGGGGWVAKTFDLATIIPQTSQMRLRFTVIDQGADSTTEGAIDGVGLKQAQCTPLVVPGDMNCDGVANAADVDAFVLALVDPASFALAYPTCSITRGDMNTDTFVNGADVQAFVARIVTP